jgi:hypothetical protein
VEVVNKMSGLRYTFPCKRWLSTQEDDQHTYRDLSCDGGATAAFVGTVYHLKIETGNDGTSANVYCILNGTKADSAKIPLDNRSKHFKKHKIDEFVVDCGVISIGALKSVTLGHDNHGMGPAWNVASVTVECPSHGKTYTCETEEGGSWLARDRGDHKLVRCFKVDPAKTTVTEIKSSWLCHVETCDERYAGTDANVFITVYGEHDGKVKRSDEIQIGNKTDNFERGKTDEFKIELDVLGKLRKVRVRHDNAGMLADWKLQSIRMVHIDTKVRRRRFAIVS